MRDKTKLTRTQQKVLTYIKKYICEQQCPPTCADIAEQFNWASHNSAWLHLQALERKGRIELSRGRSRGIKVLGQKLKFV